MIVFVPCRGIVLSDTNKNGKIQGIISVFVPCRGIVLSDPEARKMKVRVKAGFRPLSGNSPFRLDYETTSQAQESFRPLSGNSPFRQTEFFYYNQMGLGFGFRPLSGNSPFRRYP